MSPDTPDPDRPLARPDEPGRTARPGPPSTGEPAPGAGMTVPTGNPSDGTPPTAADPDASTPGDPVPGPAAGPPMPWETPGDPVPAPAGPAGPPVGPDLPRRRVVRVAVGAALGLTVLGVPLGLLWAALAPDTPVVKTAEGAIYAQPQPEQPIAADGWFSLLGLGFGVLVALALWFLPRLLRGPAGLLAAVAGSLGAALLAWQTGRRIGLSAYQRLLETAPEGRAFGKPADLRAGGVEWLLGVLPVPYGNLLLPAFGAAVTYTLLAGWSRWPSLRPEPAPGAPEVSWGSEATPAPPAAPEPPAPGAAEPPRG